MPRNTLLAAMAATLLLAAAPASHAQIDPANLVGGTTQVTLSGFTVPPTVLYTVPAGRTLVLTDFDYVFWSIAEPTFTSQMTLREGSSDKWTWTAFLSQSPPWETSVERSFGTGLVFGPGTQVVLAQTVTSASSGDRCAVSWACYLTP